MNRYGRWGGVLLLAGLVLLVPMQSLAIQTTSVQGIVYRADGSVAQGTILVSWPSFTAADGSAVAAGNTSVTIAPDGSVSLGLAPNAGANPQGTYYTVVYHLNDGTVQKEYWVVPQAATATISELRARVVPAAVAQQSVTQQYVDTAISALQGSYLQLKGGTLSGVLNLSSDPTNALQAATKEYVDAHAGEQLPQARNVIAGSGNGGAVSMMEKGVSVTGANGNVAWDDDLNGGVYDPRDPRWAGGIYGPTPAAALQAMSNQMACDLATGAVTQATARLPQGSFAVDNLLLAPGSSWEGAKQSDGGTTLHTIYNNHFAMQAPATMTVTCNGATQTDSMALTHVAHLSLAGCDEGGCTNAPGDTANYLVSGPNNTGLEMSSNGVVEYVLSQFFGGYGIRVDGIDAKSYHNRTYSNDEWYYYGQYKGVTESAVSAEASAVVTGSTGSVALTWPAVANATGYVIYRGTSSGGESVFYQSATNSFTDTGAANNAGVVTNVVTNTLGAPGAITATSSASGGTLAAGSYFYKITATTADGWHASFEALGLDGEADWIEVYGLFDAPTVFTYHHIADFLGGGGYSRFSHIWPQLGQVGIAEPFGYGTGESYENVRIDFARLEGMYVTDANVSLHGGVIDGSCTAPNAVTINSGQEGARFAGQCDQFWSAGAGTNLADVLFADDNGFGPTFKTADYLVEGGDAWVRNVGSHSVPQLIPNEGLAVGNGFEPSNERETNVTQNPTYGWANIQGLTYVNLADTTPASYWSFTNIVIGQDFYVAGGNSNVTLLNDNLHITTCSGNNINLGTVRGLLHFKVTAASTDQGFGSGFVREICNSDDLAGSETVTYSATPTFSAATRASIITLTGNITSFTLPAGLDGQGKTLTFCQNATGGFTAAAPANVRGLFTVGSTASKCSSQHFTYAAGQTAWLADSPGVTNE